MEEGIANKRTRYDRGEAPPIIMIEVGSLLGYLLKNENGSRFMSGISEIRNSLEWEWGFHLPPFLLKENPLIDERTYRFLFREEELARSRVHPGKTLVITSKDKLTKIPGKIDADPIYKRPCVWIEPRDSMKLHVTEPYTASIDKIIHEHLEMTLRANTRIFITRQLISNEVTDINLIDPGLVHVVLTKINLNFLVSIMRNLVSEGIPLTFIKEIMRAIANIDIPRDGNPDMITEILRKIFRNKLHTHIFGDRLLLFTVPSNKLQLWFYCKDRDNKLNNEDPVVKSFISQLTGLYISFQGKGFRLGVICSAPVRLILRRLLEKRLPDVVVLKPGEIDPDKDILVIKKIEVKSLKLWLNWQWFWLSAKSPEKVVLKSSFKVLFDYLRKRKEKYMGGKLKEPSRGKLYIPSFQDKLTGEPGENLPVPAHFTARQKTAIFLMDCSRDLLRNVLDRLSSREIAILGREMSRLPGDLVSLKREALKNIPDLTLNRGNPEKIADFIRRNFKEDMSPVKLSPLYKLAVLISSLSPSTSDLMYSHILRDLPREELKELILDNNDYKLTSTPDLRASIIEDFLWFYKGSCQPSVLYSREHWIGELQRIVIRSPKKVSLAIRDLWLENSFLLERFERFVRKSPSYASFWIRQYISKKRETGINLTSIEKASILIRLLPHELSHNVTRQLDGVWRRLFSNLPRKEKPGPEESWTVLTQFLSNYYCTFESKLFSKTHLN